MQPGPNGLLPGGAKPWTADERAAYFAHHVDYAIKGGVFAQYSSPPAPASRDYYIREASLIPTASSWNEWWTQVCQERDSWPEWHAHLAWLDGEPARRRSAGSRKGWETRRRRAASYQ